MKVYFRAWWCFVAGSRVGLSRLLEPEMLTLLLAIFMNECKAIKMLKLMNFYATDGWK